MSEQNGKQENVRPQNSADSVRNPQSRENENRDGKNGGRNYHNNGSHRGNGNGGYRTRGHYDKDRRENPRQGKGGTAESAGQKTGAAAQNSSQPAAARHDGRSAGQQKNMKPVQNTENGENANSNVQGQAGNNRHNRPSRGYQREYNKGRGSVPASIKVEETKEDIIRDIGRIEKEIELEIKEISALKFGI